MIKKIDETYQLLCENERTQLTRDAASLKNKFTTKPQGIIIEDSYNNLFFPIRPKPRLDTSKVDLIEVYKRYKELYAQNNIIFLPWHFCVEMVGNRYFVFNTRPIDMKFPLTTNEIMTRDKSNWSNTTKNFFTNKIFDISQAIHICIIGDSNFDVYTVKTYNVIGRICINPITRQFRLPGGLYQRIFPLNLGRRFNLKQITKFIRI